MTTQTESSLDNVTIKRGRVDSLTVYEVTESELELLENGSPASTNLNFSIFLISTGLSFLSTILVVKIESIRTFIVFCLIAIIGIVLGFIMGCLWHRDCRRITTTIRKIKDRITTCDQQKDTTVPEINIV